ncbi:MAG TPA: lipid A biosynthesis acyltransferase, partial [Pirellulales bacterium]
RLGRPMQFEMGLEDMVDPNTMDEALNDVKALTQWFTGVLEGLVRRAPEQYWWVHRRWKDNRKTKSASRREAA